MTDIKPIETVYNGYRFRSRLEARWAVFFDALGIEYIYEPEGFTFPDGTNYLPDFYLPKMNTFFEVKGIMGADDVHKIEQLRAHSGKFVAIGYGDMTFEADSWCGEDENGKPLTIPDSKDMSCLALCTECQQYYFMGYTATWQCRCCGAYDGDGHFGVMAEGDLKHIISDEVKNAITKARQARFEHGESPTREIIKATTDINKEEVLKSFFDSFDELKDEIDF